MANSGVTKYVLLSFSITLKYLNINSSNIHNSILPIASRIILPSLSFIVFVFSLVYFSSPHMSFILLILLRLVA